MLLTTFNRIELLSSSSQIRTLLPPLTDIPRFGESESSQQGKRSVESSYDSLWCKVVEWSVLEYERWRHHDQGERPVSVDDEQSGGRASSTLAAESRLSANGDTDDPTFARADRPDEVGEASDLTPFFLFTTLATLLRVEKVLPAASGGQIAADTLSHLPSVPPLHRAALLDISGPYFSTGASYTPLSARLYLLDALSRLVAHQYEQVQLAAAHAAQTRRQIREATLAAEHAKFGELQARLAEVETRLAEEAQRKKERAGRDRLVRERLQALEEEVDRLSLLARRTRSSEAPSMSGREIVQVDWRYALGAGLVLGVAIGVALAAGGSGAV
ncbi:hypothetical protein JCM10908_005075 [Rhodotorula pacifica]|uniref:uncharacterized protein n=1 Tax=Rhodotorula pacifica TaxID=1495444 RepID=UPI0031803212